MVADFDAAVPIDDRVVTDEDIGPEGNLPSERPKHHAFHQLAVITDRNTSLAPKISVGGKVDALLEAASLANHRAADPRLPDSEARTNRTSKAGQEFVKASHRIRQD